MRTKVSLRDVTPEERMTVERLAHSRTAAVRLVERAQIILATLHGERPSAIARRLALTRPTVYTWIHRFNDQGVAGLEDRLRCGCPATYAADQKAEVIALALTEPQTLGLPFGCWTLDRLQTYLNEHTGIAMKRSRINEILLAEGLRWRQQESWFGERVDPDFAEKRGSSKPSTVRRPSTVW
ncbi:MAG TPA: helix-turn-helix domain-containing protein [Pyrinomonadaceae bacterium]